MGSDAFPDVVINFLKEMTSQQTHLKQESEHQARAFWTFREFSNNEAVPRISEDQQTDCQLAAVQLNQVRVRATFSGALDEPRTPIQDRIPE